MFGGNFAPSGWAFCNGATLPIEQYETLFQLIGTIYGGDGEATFALPDLQGRLPLHRGNGFVLGEFAGVEAVALTTNQMPTHTHALQASGSAGSQATPGGNVVAQSPGGSYIYSATTPTAGALSPSAVSQVGSGQRHTNLQPYICISFIISLFGVFPNQS